MVGFSYTRQIKLWYHNLLELSFKLVPEVMVGICQICYITDTPEWQVLCVVQ